ncbi:MAG: hypothetical protein MK538_04860 [Planctomycetes bacterium]|nr:hypothetical protein [Planctomycetota bacterium]
MPSSECDPNDYRCCVPMFPKVEHQQEQHVVPLPNEVRHRQLRAEIEQGLDFVLGEEVRLRVLLDLKLRHLPARIARQDLPFGARLKVCAQLNERRVDGRLLAALEERIAVLLEALDREIPDRNVPKVLTEPLVRPALVGDGVRRLDRLDVSDVHLDDR